LTAAIHMGSGSPEFYTVIRPEAAERPFCTVEWAGIFKSQPEVRKHIDEAACSGIFVGRYQVLPAMLPLPFDSEDSSQRWVAPSAERVTPPPSMSKGWVGGSRAHGWAAMSS
jgi:hypothetical protein